MKVITDRDLIREVSARWNKQYAHYSEGSEHKEIGRKLAALNGETATASEVNALIGNTAWTSLTCDECRTDTCWVLEVGQEPDYESHTAQLCITCARKVGEIAK